MYLNPLMPRYAKLVNSVTGRKNGDSIFEQIAAISISSLLGCLGAPIACVLHLAFDFHFLESIVIAILASYSLLQLATRISQRLDRTAEEQWVEVAKALRHSDRQEIARDLKHFSSSERFAWLSEHISSWQSAKVQKRIREAALNVLSHRLHERATGLRYALGCDSASLEQDLQHHYTRSATRRQKLKDANLTKAKAHELRDRQRLLDNL